MKKWLFFWGLIVGLLVLTRCEEPHQSAPVPILPHNEPAYSALEKNIRSENDYRAVFTWSQYNDLLLELTKDKFLVMPLDEMRVTYNSGKVVVGLRHDIDFNPFKALEMANIEKHVGLRATYFILPTADYYGYMFKTGLIRSVGLDSLILELYRSGAEIGMHNDLLTAMIEYGFDPLRFNKNELHFIRALGIPVHGTSSHGSAIAKSTVPNFQIFSDFAKSDSVSYKGKKYRLGEFSLKEYGYTYEAYFIDFSIYFSDAGGKWNDPAGLKGIIEKLEKSLPGNRIQILAHPDWWGKQNN